MRREENITESGQSQWLTGSSMQQQHFLASFHSSTLSSRHFSPPAPPPSPFFPSLPAFTFSTGSFSARVCAASASQLSMAPSFSFTPSHGHDVSITRAGSHNELCAQCFLHNVISRHNQLFSSASLQFFFLVSVHFTCVTNYQQQQCAAPI